MSIQLLDYADAITNNSLLSQSPVSLTEFREMLAILLDKPKTAFHPIYVQQNLGKRGPEDQSGSSGGSSDGDRNTRNQNKHR